MNLLMGVPLKATIATSNLMIGVTAATGAAIFYGRGFMDPYYAVPARSASSSVPASGLASPVTSVGAGVLGIVFQVVLAGLRRADDPQGSGARAVNDSPQQGSSAARTSWSRSSAPSAGSCCAVSPSASRSWLRVWSLGVAQGVGLPRGVVPLAELLHGLVALQPAAYLSLGLIVHHRHAVRARRGVAGGLRQRARQALRAGDRDRASRHVPRRGSRQSLNGPLPPAANLRGEGRPQAESLVVECAACSGMRDRQLPGVAVEQESVDFVRAQATTEDHASLELPNIHALARHFEGAARPGQSGADDENVAHAESLPDGSKGFAAPGSTRSQ